MPTKNFLDTALARLRYWQRIICEIVLVNFIGMLLLPVAIFATASPKLDTNSTKFTKSPCKKREGFIDDEPLSTMTPQPKVNLNSSTVFTSQIELGGRTNFRQRSNGAVIYELFIPFYQTDNQLSFCDAKIFDRTGREVEGNLHFGWRYFDEQRHHLFGVYIGYDIKRDEWRHRYQQLVFGGELWYQQFFLGFNYYQPLKRQYYQLTDRYASSWITPRYLKIKHQIREQRNLGGGDCTIGYDWGNGLTSYLSYYYFHDDLIGSINGPKIYLLYEYQPAIPIFWMLNRINLEVGAQYDKLRGKSYFAGIKFKFNFKRNAQHLKPTDWLRHVVDMVRRDDDIILEVAQHDDDIILEVAQPDSEKPHNTVEQREKESSSSSNGNRDSNHGNRNSNSNNGNRNSGTANNRYSKEDFLHDLADLGIDANVTKNEFRHYYRQAQLKLHPDRGGDPEIAMQKNATFTRILTYGNEYFAVDTTLADYQKSEEQIVGLNTNDEKDKHDQIRQLPCSSGTTDLVNNNVLINDTSKPDVKERKLLGTTKVVTNDTDALSIIASNSNEYVLTKGDEVIFKGNNSEHILTKCVGDLFHQPPPIKYPAVYQEVNLPVCSIPPTISGFSAVERDMVDLLSSSHAFPELKEWLLKQRNSQVAANGLWKIAQVILEDTAQQDQIRLLDEWFSLVYCSSNALIITELRKYAALTYGAAWLKEIERDILKGTPLTMRAQYGLFLCYEQNDQYLESINLLNKERILVPGEQWSKWYTIDDDIFKELPQLDFFHAEEINLFLTFIEQVKLTSQEFQAALATLRRKEGDIKQPVAIKKLKQQAVFERIKCIFSSDLQPLLVDIVQSGEDLGSTVWLLWLKRHQQLSNKLAYIFHEVLIFLHEYRNVLFKQLSDAQIEQLQALFLSVPIEELLAHLQQFLSSKQLSMDTVKSTDDLLQEFISLNDFHGSEFITEIRNVLNIMQQKRDQLSLQSDFDFVAWCNHFRGTSLSDVHDLGEALAVLSIAIHKQFQYYPRTAQLLTVIVLFRGKKLSPASLQHGTLAQVNTGEGKTVIVYMLAVLRVLTGDYVDIITSSSELAERDAAEIVSLYQLLGITSACVTEDTPDLHMIYQSDVLYGTTQSMIGNQLRNDLQDHFGIRRSATVIIDEVDNMLFEGVNYRIMLLSPLPGYRELINLLPYLWQEFSRIIPLVEITYEQNGVAKCRLKNLAKTYAESSSINGTCWRDQVCSLPEDEAGMFVNLKIDSEIRNAWNAVSQQDLGERCDEFITAMLADYLENLINQKVVYAVDYLRNHLRNSLKSWVNSLLHFHEYVEGENYIIRYQEPITGEKYHKIVIVDNQVTGTIHNTMQWSNALSSLLSYRHGLDMPADDLVTVFRTIPTYFNMYDQIYGLTGTLGTKFHKQFLHDIYQVNSWVMPAFKVNQRIEAQPVFVADSREWLVQILTLVGRGIIRRQPMLIILATINEVMQVADLLQKNYAELNILTYSLGGEAERAKLLAPLNSGTVVIATNLGGRGLDLKLTEEALQAGGLFVIKSGFSENSRVEQQALGRAARKGDPGNTQLVLNIDELRKQGFAIDALLTKNLTTVELIDQLYQQRELMEQRSLNGASRQAENQQKLDKLYDNYMVIAHQINRYTRYRIRILGTLGKIAPLTNDEGLIYQRDGELFLALFHEKKCHGVLDLRKALQLLGYENTIFETITLKPVADIEINVLNAPLYRTVEFLLSWLGRSFDPLLSNVMGNMQLSEMVVDIYHLLYEHQACIDTFVNAYIFYIAHNQDDLKSYQFLLASNVCYNRRDKLSRQFIKHYQLIIEKDLKISQQECDYFNELIDQMQLRSGLFLFKLASSAYLKKSYLSQYREDFGLLLYDVERSSDDQYQNLAATFQEFAQREWERLASGSFIRNPSYLLQDVRDEIFMTRDDYFLYLPISILWYRSAQNNFDRILSALLRPVPQEETSDTSINIKENIFFYDWHSKRFERFISYDDRRQELNECIKLCDGDDKRLWIAYYLLAFLEVKDRSRSIHDTDDRDKAVAMLQNFIKNMEIAGQLVMQVAAKLEAELYRQLELGLSPDSEARYSLQAQYYFYQEFICKNIKSQIDIAVEALRDDEGSVSYDGKVNLTNRIAESSFDDIDNFGINFTETSNNASKKDIFKHFLQNNKIDLYLSGGVILNIKKITLHSTRNWWDTILTGVLGIIECLVGLALFAVNPMLGSLIFTQGQSTLFNVVMAVINKTPLNLGQQALGSLISIVKGVLIAWLDKLLEKALDFLSKKFPKLSSLHEKIKQQNLNRNQSYEEQLKALKKSPLQFLKNSALEGIKSSTMQLIQQEAVSYLVGGERLGQINGNAQAKAAQKIDQIIQQNEAALRRIILSDKLDELLDRIERRFQNYETGLNAEVTETLNVVGEIFNRYTSMGKYTNYARRGVDAVDAYNRLIEIIDNFGTDVNNIIQQMGREISDLSAVLSKRFGEWLSRHWMDPQYAGWGADYIRRDNHYLKQVTELEQIFKKFLQCQQIKQVDDFVLLTRHSFYTSDQLVTLSDPIIMHLDRRFQKYIAVISKITSEITEMAKDVTFLPLRQKFLQLVLSYRKALSNKIQTSATQTAIEGVTQGFRLIQQIIKDRKERRIQRQQEINNQTASSDTQHYIVKKGDCLEEIAKQHGVTVQKLIALNPEIKDPNKIYEDQKIILPSFHHNYPAEVNIDLLLLERKNYTRGNSIDQFDDYLRQFNNSLDELSSLKDRILQGKPDADLNLTAGSVLNVYQLLGSKNILDLPNDVMMTREGKLGNYEILSLLEKKYGFNSDELFNTYFNDDPNSFLKIVSPLLTNSQREQLASTSFANIAHVVESTPEIHGVQNVKNGNHLSLSGDELLYNCAHAADNAYAKAAENNYEQVSHKLMMLLAQGKLPQEIQQKLAESDLSITKIDKLGALLKTYLPKISNLDVNSGDLSDRRINESRQGKLLLTALSRFSTDDKFKLLFACNNPVIQPLTQRGYNFVKTIYDKETGYHGVIFERTVNGQQEIILANRGTKNTGDIPDDVRIMTRNIPSQHEAAVAEIERLKQQYPQAKIITTGHSLGGAIAQYVTVRMGVVSYSFDTPACKTGLNEVAQKYQTKIDLNKFHIYNTFSNPVNSGVQDEHIVQPNIIYNHGAISHSVWTWLISPFLRGSAHSHSMEDIKNAIAPDGTYDKQFVIYANGSLSLNFADYQRNKTAVDEQIYAYWQHERAIDEATYNEGQVMWQKAAQKLFGAAALPEPITFREYHRKMIEHMLKNGKKDDE